MKWFTQHGANYTTGVRFQAQFPTAIRPAEPHTITSNVPETQRPKLYTDWFALRIAKLSCRDTYEQGKLYYCIWSCLKAMFHSCLPTSRPTPLRQPLRFSANFRLKFRIANRSQCKSNLKLKDEIKLSSKKRSSINFVSPGKPLV
jgi:hypothetical protein